MSNYLLNIDENFKTKDFIKNSINKYFDPFLSENILVSNIVKELIFSKLEDESEEFFVEFTGNTLKFSGGDRSVIYAFYDFLFKLGWRFFTPKLEVFLHYNKKINFKKPFAYSFKPLFEYRLMLWDGYTDDWKVKNGLNAFYSYVLPDNMGGSIGYAGSPVHTLGKFIPFKDYFDSNPEFFALDKSGKRIKNQLCLSNENLFNEVVKKAKEKLKENPQAKIISISQNDCNGECQCENCKAIKKDGNPSDVLIYFVNKVAREIKKEFPAVKVQTIAYMYTIEAPKYYIPEDNVLIEICPIGSCENHAANDETCWRNKDLVRQIDGWKSITSNIYLWKYYKDFNYFLTPFQLLEHQRKSFNYYAEKGIKGFWAEGSHCGETTDFAELKAYVLSKLIFNPRMTEKEYLGHLKEFCESYYGKSSGRYMLKYLKLLKTVSENSHYDCYPAPYTVIPTNPSTEKNDKYFIRQAKSIFKKAFDFAETIEYKNRIEKEYISVLYFAFYTNFENDMLNANNEKRRKVIEQQNLLFKLIDKFGIKEIRSLNSGIKVKKI